MVHFGRFLKVADLEEGPSDRFKMIDSLELACDKHLIEVFILGDSCKADRKRDLVSLLE